MRASKTVPRNVGLHRTAADQSLEHSAPGVFAVGACSRGALTNCQGPVAKIFPSSQRSFTCALAGSFQLLQFAEHLKTISDFLLSPCHLDYLCLYYTYVYIYIHIIHITYALVFRCTKYVSVPREWRCFVISQATFELRLAVWWFCSRRSLQICTYDFWRWCFALDHGSLFAWQTVNTNLKTNFVQYRGLAGPTVS